MYALTLNLFFVIIKVRRLLDIVKFKGEGAAKVLLQFLQKSQIEAVPQPTNEKLIIPTSVAGG